MFSANCYSCSHNGRSTEEKEQKVQKLSDRIENHRKEVQYLIKQGGEQPQYEFKRALSLERENLDDRLDFVKLMQAVANAEIATERCIVIGADPKEKKFLAVTNKQEFDPANISKILSLYLDPLPKFETFNLTTDDNEPIVLIALNADQSRPITGVTEWGNSGLQSESGDQQQHADTDGECDGDSVHSDGEGGGHLGQFDADHPPDTDGHAGIELHAVSQSQQFEPDAGNQGTSTITIAPQNGFSGSVSLSASGLPSGVTAAFNPNPATSSSTLILTASATATPFAGTVTVTGTSGNLTQTTPLTLTSAAPPDFTLARFRGRPLPKPSARAKPRASCSRSPRSILSPDRLI